MSKIYVQNATPVFQYSGSLSASGGTSACISGSAYCAGYSRLIGGLISNASSIAGSGVRIRQSFDGGANWDSISASDQVAACTAYSTEVNIRGNAVVVEYRNAGTAASLVRANFVLLPI